MSCKRGSAKVQEEGSRKGRSGLAADLPVTSQGEVMLRTVGFRFPFSGEIREVIPILKRAREAEEALGGLSIRRLKKLWPLRFLSLRSLRERWFLSA
ncbi:MAG: hypothetical protein QM786_05010 [Breznakibacter sp.]